MRVASDIGGTFTDLIYLDEVTGEIGYNMCYAKPAPFVPRYLRLEVGERVNHKGEELQPLHEDDVREAAAFLKKGACGTPDHRHRRWLGQSLRTVRWGGAGRRQEWLHHCGNGKEGLRGDRRS
jgi:hypothetical protein